MPDQPTPGEVAYTAYILDLENTLPAGSVRWQEQAARVQAAWEAAAQAVLTMQKEEEHA